MKCQFEPKNRFNGKMIMYSKKKKKIMIKTKGKGTSDEMIM